MAEKIPKNLASNPSSVEQEAQADVLPEVLKHSLPFKIFGQPSYSSSISKASKWALHSDPNNASISSPDALNPLRAYVSLPQVTFGPKRSDLPLSFITNFGFFFFLPIGFSIVSELRICRWELPSTEHSVMASTANELRKDKYTPINPEKLKAAAEGLQRSMFIHFSFQCFFNLFLCHKL